MSLCILTTSTALFPPASPGCGRFIRTLSLEAEGQSLALPGADDYTRIYNELECEFNAILVLTAPEAVVPGAETARLAAQSHGGTAKISVLETLQIGPGLGILTQLAARKAAAGASLLEVEDYIRSVIPYLFTILCPDTTPGAPGKKSTQNGDQSGALLVYLLDEGLLMPYKKVRTQRHLLENLQEFLGEFEKPQRLVYFHGKNASLHTRPLRETAAGTFPGVHFVDLVINEALASLFGECTVGLTVLEKPGENIL
ncbi:MAG TPA: hypothetical protein VGK00_18425 [Anaerolineales bacterium]|jgi:fatty acid-binding protein DegV